MLEKPSARSGFTRRALLKLAGGTAFAGALEESCPPGRRSEASQAEQTGIAAIDTHIHVAPSGLPAVKSQPIKDREEMLVKELAQANVKLALAMGTWNAPKDDPLGVAVIIKLAAKVPGLRAVGVADPTRIDGEHLKAVEAQLDRHRDKIVALKAYLGYLHFGPEHPNYVPYYKLAAKHHLPVIFHTGDNWSTAAHVKYAHPLRVDEVAVDHAEVRFVLAHFGNPWFTDAAEVAFKNTNVWADLSGLAVGGEMEFRDLLAAAKTPDSIKGLVFSDLKKAIGYVGDFKRFLYGSDWPLAPMASYRRLIETIIPKEHHDEVFRTNAEHVFGLGPKVSENGS
jgi:uncharacterized protein